LQETKIDALKNITFSIKSGESLAIMGDVGSRNYNNLQGFQNFSLRML